MSTFKLVKKRLNPNIEIQGVVLSMFDGRANLSIQVVEEVKKYFKGSVYTTLIPRNVRLAEAPSYGKQYFTIIDFRNVTDKFADKDFDGAPVRIKESKQDDKLSEEIIDLAEKMAAECEDPVRKAELLRIASCTS